MTRTATVSLTYRSGPIEIVTVFSGSPDEIGAQATVYSGLSEEQANAPVADVVGAAAQRIFAVALLAEHFDATPVAASGPRSAGPPSPIPTAAPASEPLAGLDPLYQQIADTTEVDDLKRLYGKHKSTFDTDNELMDAWRARGRALQAQATRD
jgi:hypothetical protein